MRRNSVSDRPLGRAELLSWLGNVLQTDSYTKLEQLSDGIAYLQLFEHIFPDALGPSPTHLHGSASGGPLHTPKNNVRQDSLKRFQALQQTLSKNDLLKRPLPIERLVDAKFSDHLDLLQWMHSQAASRQPALLKAPVHRPVHSISVDLYGSDEPGNSTQKVVTSSNDSSSGGGGTTKRQLQSHHYDHSERRIVQMDDENVASSVDRQYMFEDGENVTDQVLELERLAGSLQEELEEEIQEVDELALHVSDAAMERDFYFDKLRSIEVLCEMHGEHDRESSAAILNVIRARFSSI
eukprot:ANDGO_06498.mRNA.1 Protein BIM1